MFDNHDWTVVGDAVVKVLRDPEALQDRSNLFVAFKQTPLHSIKSLSLEFNWPFAASKLLPQEIASNIKRKVAPTSARLPLGVRVYKLVGEANNPGQAPLSYRFAWRDAPTARGHADNNMNRLESIKSLGDAENDDSYYGMNTPKVRKPTVRMTFNRGSRNRLKSIDPEEVNSPLSMMSPGRRGLPPNTKRPVGFSAFAMSLADTRPMKKASQSPPV